MTTEARTDTQGENEVALLANGEQELAALHARIGPHFRRAEVRVARRIRVKSDSSGKAYFRVLFWPSPALRSLEGLEGSFQK